jgi:hypothetical protein
MPLTPEHECWAGALQVEKVHGHTAREFVTVQIATLALKGNRAAVERWQEIAARLDQLRSGPWQ